MDVDGDDAVGLGELRDDVAVAVAGGWQAVEVAALSDGVAQRVVLSFADQADCIRDYPVCSVCLRVRQ